MEMQQIRYFLSLAQTLNFTRAAEECNVSQPALTRAIQALEGELGGELIRREGRLSHLTELGKRMLPLMQRCYESAITAKDLARAVTRNEVAPLSLGVSHSVNLEMFMEPVAELFRSFPGIQLRISHGSAAELLKRLKDGEIDLAVAGPIEDSWERLDRWALFSEGFEITMPVNHALAATTMIEVDSLGGHPVFIQSVCESKGEVMEWFGERGVAFVTSHEIDCHHDLKSLLEASGGVAIVPESAPRPSNLKRAKINGLKVMRTVSAYAVAGRARSSTTAALLNILRAADFVVEAA
ncbi:MAG: LysR family transcriptional regulator [Parvularculaceae bacterium]